MKRLLTLCALLVATSAFGQFEARTRSLKETLNLISERFDVKLKCEIDTAGRVVPFADFRIRPYSLEESLQNVVGLFDAKFVKQNDHYYKIKPFEHHRRTPADGEKMLAYLRSLYTDQATFEARGAAIRQEVRAILELDTLLAQRVALQPILSKVRKFDGYTVQNIAIQTLPGRYLCGSIYAPTKKGTHPVIICPN